MKVVSARTLEQALEALATATPATRLLAGGTDLMVELQTGRAQPDLVVEIGGVSELRAIRETEQGLVLGAACTCSDLIASSLAARFGDILVSAARDVGAVQIQNRATLGGNLGTASPAADLTPALLALGATLQLRSHGASRELPLSEFFTGYRQTARRPDELIAGVVLPPRPPNELRAFRKVGTRRAQSISKLVLALAVSHEQGRVLRARVAAGSVADRSIRMTHLERALEAGATGDERSAAIAHSVAHDASPQDDVRSSAQYRSAVLGRVLTRMLAGLPES